MVKVVPHQDSLKKPILHPSSNEHGKSGALPLLKNKRKYDVLVFQPGNATNTTNTTESIDEKDVLVGRHRKNKKTKQSGLTNKQTESHTASNEAKRPENEDKNDKNDKDEEDKTLDPNTSWCTLRQTFHRALKLRESNPANRFQSFLDTNPSLMTSTQNQLNVCLRKKSFSTRKQLNLRVFEYMLEPSEIKWQSVYLYFGMWKTSTKKYQFRSRAKSVSKDVKSTQKPLLVASKVSGNHLKFYIEVLMDYINSRPNKTKKEGLLDSIALCMEVLYHPQHESFCASSMLRLRFRVNQLVNTTCEDEDGKPIFKVASRSYSDIMDFNNYPQTYKPI